MTLAFKKPEMLAILIVIQTFFSCTKSVGETAAIKIAGTFKGTMTIIHTNGTPSSDKYNDFVVKVEHLSNEKVLVSCASTPKGFDNFETVVSLANNTITSYGSQNVNLFYQTTTKQMSLNVISAASTASFFGYKQ